MSWDLESTMKALAAALVDIGPTVFDQPPASFNAPALVVLYPDSVDFDTQAFGVDLVSTPILVAVGIEQAGTISELVTDVKAAINADRRLGGLVQSTRVTGVRTFRALEVSGARFLSCEVVVEVTK
jgi:hypothetical protein